MATRQHASFMTEELHTDTKHNRSFRTHNGYLAAFRYLAFDGRRFGALDYHLGKLADRSLGVYGDHIKPVKIAVDREAACGCLYPHYPSSSSRVGGEGVSALAGTRLHDV
jgi:hypothetical protein